MASRLPAETGMGRVVLRVSDLERQVAFYRDVVGVPTVERTGGRATLSAGDTTLFELIEDPDAAERPRAATGLFHAAVRVPDRRGLADALARIREEWTLDGAADHDVSEALYLVDPEGNGVEIYRDRPRSEWDWTDDGRVRIGTAPLELSAIDGGDADATLPPIADMGHVHLEVSAVSASRSFYTDAVGFDEVGVYEGDGAAFLGAGGYHHHLAVNAWNGRTAPVGDHRGLERFEIAVPDADALAATERRLNDHSVAVERRGDHLRIEDPDGIEVRIVVGE